MKPNPVYSLLALSGFQILGAVYNCITCQYDSCEFPLDCPGEIWCITGFKHVKEDVLIRTWHVLNYLYFHTPWVLIRGRLCFWSFTKLLGERKKSGFERETVERFYFYTLYLLHIALEVFFKSLASLCKVMADSHTFDGVPITPVQLSRCFSISSLLLHSSETRLKHYH